MDGYLSIFLIDEVFELFPRILLVVIFFFMLAWVLASDFDTDLYILRSFIIRIILINFIVLEPSRAALDAFEICATLAAFLLPPFREFAIQTKSNTIVDVESKSNQK